MKENTSRDGGDTWTAAAHIEEHEAQTTTGPSESKLEPQQKKGHKNKIPTKVRVVEEINRDGVLVKPDKIQGPATHACGCLAREAIRIIHDDWCKVPREKKDYIWQNWIKWFRVPVGTEPDVQKWVLKIANKAFKDWKSDRKSYLISQFNSEKQSKLSIGLLQIVSHTSKNYILLSGAT